MLKLKIVLRVFIAPMYLYACLRMSGHAPNETMDILWDLFCDLYQELVLVLVCTPRWRQVEENTMAKMCFIGFRCGPVSVVSSFSRNCLYTLTTRGRALCPALLQYLCVSYNLLHVLETVLGDTTNLLAVKLSDVPSWRSWSTYPGSIGSTVFY